MRTKKDVEKCPHKTISEEEFFDRLSIARKHAEEGRTKDALEVSSNVRNMGLAK